MLDNAQLDELRIQPVGEGEDMIDLICPPEKIDAFLDLCNTEGIEIKGFSWWCHVTEGHEPCGMGGPKSSFFEGWFSEIPMDDIVRLSDNASYSTFFKYIWPEEDNYHDCWWPGFWLESLATMSERYDTWKTLIYYLPEYYQAAKELRDNYLAHNVEVDIISEKEQGDIEYARKRKYVEVVFIEDINNVMAIFNSVVEIYKPLIKEYHTSTLMALA